MSKWTGLSVSTGCAADEKTNDQILADLDVNLAKVRAQRVNPHVVHAEVGASEGIRTLDIHLGKVTLYQAELRSLPERRSNGRETGYDCKLRFNSL